MSRATLAPTDASARIQSARQRRLLSFMVSCQMMVAMMLMVVVTVVIMVILVMLLSTMVGCKMIN